MKTHSVKLGNSIFRFEHWPTIKRLEMPIDLFWRSHLLIQRANDNNRKFESLRLMNGHYLNVTFRKGLVWIFILVDSPVIEQSEKTIEQVVSDIFAIFEGCHRVVIVILK